MRSALISTPVTGECSLSEVNQTLCSSAAMSAYDPKRTFHYDNNRELPLALDTGAGNLLFQSASKAQ